MAQDQTSQAITGFAAVYTGIPCFIQPASAQLQYYYEQRGTTVTHTVYTTATQNTYLREDVLEDASGNQYHLVAGPLNALESNLYIQLACEQYPEGAKQRLDVGELP